MSNSAISQSLNFHHNNTYHSNTYHSRTCARSKPLSNSAQPQRKYDGRPFIMARDLTNDPRKNTPPEVQPARPIGHGYTNGYSSPRAQTVPNPYLQPLAQSREGSASPGAGCKMNHNNYWYLEQDSWNRAIDQENQELKAIIRMKDKKIIALVLKDNKRKKQITRLKEELLEVKSKLREQARLLTAEKTHHAKHKEEYAKGIEKIQNLSNHLRKKYSVWKWRHEKLSIDNKNLIKKLNRTESKLKYNEELLAKQKEKLSGWGTAFSEANDEDDSEVSPKDKSEKKKIQPTIYPKGEVLENPNGLKLKDLLNLKREEWNLKNLPKIVAGQRQMGNRLKSPIPHNPEKCRLRQLFEPGLGLVNPNDSTKADLIESCKSDSSESFEYQRSDDDEFWMLPNPPSVIDVEKWLTDNKKVSQYEQGYKTETGKTSQPGTPSSLSSTQHYQVYQTKPGETSQPGTPSSSSVSSTIN